MAARLDRGLVIGPRVAGLCIERYGRLPINTVVMVELPPSLPRDPSLGRVSLPRPDTGKRKAQWKQERQGRRT